MALESKLVVGRYIDSPRSHCNSSYRGTSTFGGNLFNCQPSNIDSIKESTAQSWNHPFTRESAIKDSKRMETNKQHRNFHWLYWLPGEVNYLSREVDVLSGPFSGCWLIVFQYQKVDYVAHIATSTETLAAKTAWNTFTATFTNEDYIIGGFIPHLAVKKKQEEVRNVVPECWGLVTHDNKFFSVLVVNNGGKSKIEDIVPVNSAPLDRLRNLP